MHRKFKVIGIVLIAALATTAVSAAGAQAKSFHSETATTYFEGSQVGTNVFTTTAGTVKCKKTTLTGHITISITITISIHKNHSECTAFGQAATVTTGGCEETLNANGTVESLTGCTSGGVVVHVPSGNCTVTVPNQHFSGANVTYANEGAGTTRDILETADVTSKISYTVDGPGTICGTAGSYNQEGTYTGSITMKGYKNAGHTEQIGIWVE
jgi:hypothetical protein